MGLGDKKGFPVTLSWLFWGFGIFPPWPHHGRQFRQNISYECLDYIYALQIYNPEEIWAFLHPSDLWYMTCPCVVFHKYCWFLTLWCLYFCVNFPQLCNAFFLPETKHHYSWESELTIKMRFSGINIHSSNNTYLHGCTHSSFQPGLSAGILCRWRVVHPGEETSAQMHIKEHFHLC